MSPPAENALLAAAVTTTFLIAGSRSHSSSARVSSRTILSVIAFSACGRFRKTVPLAPRVWQMISGSTIGCEGLDGRSRDDKLAGQRQVIYGESTAHLLSVNLNVQWLSASTTRARTLGRHGNGRGRNRFLALRVLLHQPACEPARRWTRMGGHGAADDRRALPCISGAGAQPVPSRRVDQIGRASCRERV